MHRVQVISEHLQASTSASSLEQHSSSTVHASSVTSAPSKATLNDDNEVLYLVDNKVAVITLNRPSRGNAYTTPMQEAYVKALHRANLDPNVNAIVVTGAGKMFCVGVSFVVLLLLKANRKLTSVFKNNNIG